MKLNKTAIALSALTLGITLFLSTKLFAAPLTKDEIEKQSSVLTRTQPAYDSEGIRFANFILKPLTTTSVKFDDNIFSSASNKKTDRLIIIKPEAEIHSTFDRHFMSFRAFAEHGKYQDYKDENYTDAHAAFTGRTDITGDIAIPVKLQYGREHIKRGIPDEDSVLKPTIVQTFSADTAVEYNGQNISGAIRTDLDKYTFRDNSTANGPVDNSDRNRNEVFLATFIGLSQDRLIAPFGFVGFKDISYRRDIDDNGFRRSSRSFAGGLGLNIKLSSVLKSKLQAGYNSRSFDDTRFDDINGLIYNANLLWEPSPLIALNVTARRSIVESTLSNFSASVDDTYALGAVYELMPNIFVKPGASYLIKDYKGSGIRDLKRFTSDLELTYKLNRNMWANFAYEYIKQKENAGTSTNLDFENNIYTASLQLKL
ncbi:MAG: outer membrane beta-barrel protein [Alphaproteobacteria bacterium]|nr:outer membrane beta-barrel protein [Alphaproteobacteria bacterium]